MTNEEKAKWAEQMAGFAMSDWESLPEIELYMDQVIGYMEKQLSLYQTEGGKVLTSSMINNYVKESIIPRPDHKKYNRNQLALLIMLCTFKQVLPIVDAGKLLVDKEDEEKLKLRYEEFCDQIASAVHHAAYTVSECTKENRIRLATELTATAAACKMAAQILLSEEKEEPAKKSGKSKEKVKKANHQEANEDEK